PPLHPLRVVIPPQHATTSSGRPPSEVHTSELQSLPNLVCRLLLEKKGVGEYASIKSAGGRERKSTRPNSSHRTTPASPLFFRYIHIPRPPPPHLPPPLSPPLPLTLPPLPLLLPPPLFFFFNGRPPPDFFPLSLPAPLPISRRFTLSAL